VLSIFGYRLIKTLYMITKENKRFKKDNCSPASMLSDLANKRPDDVCFFFEDQTWTYKQVMMQDIYIFNQDSHMYLSRANNKISIIALNPALCILNLRWIDHGNIASHRLLYK
jgi:hypothetical protein